MPLLSPVEALKQLYDLDRNVALPLVAGVAVFAAAAIVKSYDIDVATMALVGFYIIGLGFLLVVVASAIQIVWLKQTLGIFVSLTIIGLIPLFIISSLRVAPSIPPPWCLARFYMPCSVVERKLLAQYGKVITAQTNVPEKIAAPTVLRSPPRPGATVTSIGTGDGRGGYMGAQPLPKPAAEKPAVAQKIYIQFAGLITREAVTELNQSLRRGGWRVQGGSGERTSVAAGLNEVRYSAEEDRPAAQALADAVTATKIGAKPVTVQQLKIITPGTLELWISN